MNGKLKPKDTIRRNPDITTSNIDGEIVMMSIENGEYYGLDEIASRIWELIENPISVEKLTELLITEFDINKEECTSDTLDFLNEMADKGLILTLR